MKDSDSVTDSEVILARIFDCLAEEAILEAVDEPIDRAVGRFPLDPDTPLNHRAFNRVIADFIQHMYCHGLPLPRQLSPAQALAEAIDILERGYRNEEATGYDAAYLDAMDPKHNGYEKVILAIADLIKQHGRFSYQRWVFMTHIPSDWESRYQVNKLIFDRFRPCLSSQLQSVDPAFVTDQLPDIILNLLHSDQELLRIIS